MANPEIKTKLHAIIIDKLGIAPEEVTDDKLLADLGFDSLDAVELIMQIEKDFSISIPDDEAEKLTTVGAIQTYLESH